MLSIFNCQASETWHTGKWFQKTMFYFWCDFLLSSGPESGLRLLLLFMFWHFFLTYKPWQYTGYYYLAGFLRGHGRHGWPRVWSWMKAVVTNELQKSLRSCEMKADSSSYINDKQREIKRASKSRREKSDSPHPFIATSPLHRYLLQPYSSRGFYLFNAYNGCTPSQLQAGDVYTCDGVCGCRCLCDVQVQ